MNKIQAGILEKKACLIKQNERGDTMALFGKLMKMVSPEEKKKKNEKPAGKQDATSQETSLSYGNQIGLAENSRQMRVAKLTPREYDLYLLLLEGFTLKESAKQLTIKYSTANTHMTGIYRKLEVKSRPELIINYRGVNGRGEIK